MGESYERSTSELVASLNDTLNTMEKQRQEMQERFQAEMNENLEFIKKLRGEERKKSEEAQRTRLQKFMDFKKKAEAQATKYTRKMKDLYRKCKKATSYVSWVPGKRTWGIKGCMGKSPPSITSLNLGRDQFGAIKPVDPKEWNDKFDQIMNDVGKSGGGKGKSICGNFMISNCIFYDW